MNDPSGVIYQMASQLSEARELLVAEQRGRARDVGAASMKLMDALHEHALTTDLWLDEREAREVAYQHGWDDRFDAESMTIGDLVRQRDKLEAQLMDAWHEHALTMDLWLDAAEQAIKVDKLEAQLADAQQEISGIDAVLARRPALDKRTRAENVEHACSTAGRMTDRVHALEQQLKAEQAKVADAQREIERLKRSINKYAEEPCPQSARVAELEAQLADALEEAGQCDQWRDRFIAVSVAMGDREPKEAWKSAHDLPERVREMRAQLQEARSALDREMAKRLSAGLGGHDELEAEIERLKRMRHSAEDHDCMEMEEAFQRERAKCSELEAQLQADASYREQLRLRATITAREAELANTQAQLQAEREEVQVSQGVREFMQGEIEKYQRQIVTSEEARKQAEARVAFYEGTSDDWCPEGHERRFIANAREDGDECQICRAEAAEEKLKRLQFACGEAAVLVRVHLSNRGRDIWNAAERILALLADQPEEPNGKG